ncbi:MAG: BrnA antitoxin family protein [Azoarcus sp.]|nr:BrnA antitoxin family protein [Azoarcus sp.]
MQAHTAGTTANMPPETVTAVFADVDNYAIRHVPSQRDVNICLDRDILTSLRATGPDWQVLFNSILRTWLKTHTSTQ